MKLQDLASPQRDTVPRLSPDELTLVSARQATTSPSDYNYDLYITTRASVSEPFDAPVSFINTTTLEAGPSLSADGLTLFYMYGLQGSRIYAATRPSTSADFGPGIAVEGLYDAHANDGSPFISADGEELWFSSDRGGERDIYRAEKLGSTFGNAVALVSLHSSLLDDVPALSADKLTIYFASARDGGPGNMDIWRAHRATTADEFSEPTLVPELSSPAEDLPGWLSPDGCRFYMSSGREGVSQLFVATR